MIQRLCDIAFVNIARLFYYNYALLRYHELYISFDFIIDIVLMLHFITIALSNTHIHLRLLDALHIKYLTFLWRRRKGIDHIFFFGRHSDCIPARTSKPSTQYVSVHTLSCLGLLTLPKQNPGSPVSTATN